MYTTKQINSILVKAIKRSDADVQLIEQTDNYDDRYNELIEYCIHGNHFGFTKIDLNDQLTLVFQDNILHSILVTKDITKIDKKSYDLILLKLEENKKYFDKIKEDQERSFWEQYEASL